MAYFESMKCSTESKQSVISLMALCKPQIEYVTAYCWQSLDKQLAKLCSGFCFVSSYCYMADNVNKKVGFHGNTPPSRKQRPLIKTSLTIIILAYAVPNIAFNQANLVPFECSSHTKFRTGKKVW